MGFIQIVMAELDAIPSGASIRNKSNFEILSTLCSARGGGRIISLRADKSRGLRAGSAIVAPLLAEDVARLVEECQAEMPDFVLVEGVLLYHAVATLAHALPELPILLDMHNIESNLQAQIDKQMLPRPLRAFAHLVFARKRRACLRAEKQVAQMARLVWVCSDADRAQALALWGPLAVAVVPNPIPDWAKTEGRKKVLPSNEVLFVGHLAYPPNQRAVKLLCKGVMPRLRRLVPGPQLHVCGRRPRRRLAALVRSYGHRLTPNVVNLAEAYKEASVVAIPLHEGGGTRLKVLEAMAIGCPIVATAKAVEGLGLTQNVHYREAENSWDFAKELATVLSEPNSADEMACRALQFVFKHYSDEARLKAVINALATGGFSVEFAA
jgi:glycosyltransferase involved in cell wall biosynthesis